MMDRGRREGIDGGLLIWTLSGRTIGKPSGVPSVTHQSVMLPFGNRAAVRRSCPEGASFGPKVALGNAGNG